MKSQKVLGQKSWSIRTKEIEAAITHMGGDVGPVRFKLGKRWISPFSVAPWAEEKVPDRTPNILRALRGDFFCMPFGGNDTPWKNEKHLPHGETANKIWELEMATANQIHLSMLTSTRKGRVDKLIRLVPGHTAIYSQHIISEMSGPMSFGHHPMLLFPKQGSARLSMSSFKFGQVFPGDFENPKIGGYSTLKAGAKFTSIHRVPRIDGSFADLSIYPDREGYEDLVLFASDMKLPFAWTAATVAEEKYVWFSLKDPRILPSTIFWMSNGGRHYAPWSSRHRRVIGLEDVMSYFHSGLAESASPNSLNKAGVPTCVQMNPDCPVTVNYIMAVAPIPAGFDVVKSIEPAKNGKSVTLIAKSGKKARANIDLGFLSSAAQG